MCIDLHLHSHYSDGTLSPAGLVNEASRSNLLGIALTDHDTVEGVEKLFNAAGQAGIRAISGLEVSSFHRKYSLHILGYGLDHHSTSLNAKLKHLQEEREKRNERIITKLQELGLDIHCEELKSFSKCGQTGRPHIAGLLTKKGIVASPDEAFRLYLRREAPAWSDRFMYSAEECIAMIHRAGGVAVLAHPGQITPRPASISDLLKQLVQLEIDGIEVFYPGYSREVRKSLKNLADRHKLVITGGSDYHGDNKPNRRMAGNKQQFCPPAKLLGPLLEKINMLQHYQP